MEIICDMPVWSIDFYEPSILFHIEAKNALDTVICYRFNKGMMLLYCLSWHVFYHVVWHIVSLALRIGYTALSSPDWKTICVRGDSRKCFYVAHNSLGIYAHWSIRWTSDAQVNNGQRLRSQLRNTKLWASRSHDFSRIKNPQMYIGNMLTIFFMESSQEYP